ncbi:MAG: hypothetical protein LBH43_03615 [Treponema sp.]|jgi:hypothetical protein|nr:hypothetical protein [Treponema sp.]
MDNMIDRLLKDSTQPGVIVLSSLDFDTGQSADVIHSMVAKKHQVPVVNQRAALWPNIRAGQQTPFSRAELANDALHPSETGDRIYAENIIYLLEKILDTLP